MRAILLRDLIIALRTGGLSIAIFVHTAVLTTFIVLWGGGVPTLPGDNVYEQQRLVQTGLLTLLLPWAAIRCGAAERGDALVAVSALTAIKPSRIVIGRAAAQFLVLSVIVLCGVPMMIIAKQMSALPLRQPLFDILPALGLAAVSAAAATGWELEVSDRLGAWLAAAAVTIATVALVGGSLPRVTAAPVLFAAAVAGAVTCAGRADRVQRYLSESLS